MVEAKIHVVCIKAAVPVAVHRSGKYTNEWVSFLFVSVTVGR